MRLNVKLSEVQLLRSQATVHTLPLFVRERKFYGRAHVKITRQWKSTPSRYLFIIKRIQLLRDSLSEKMCTRQSRKVIWDTINTLFVTLQLSNLLLLLSFSIRKHTSMASRAILSNFFEEQ